ncbi:MAG: uroporphyrinogen-III C-methyltransferase, partial [Candidatus Methylomirabilales bacterium]
GHRTSDDQGKVYLVGAGPGDPELLTLKGKRCLEEADVIVYDYLANERLLSHAPPEAERIYVGKRGGEHTLSQGEINRLLIERARAGKLVVRLKGGDPFIFGRGGEEAEALVEAGLPFEVVPGVTAAIAVPSYAGIPLTHRDMASSVGFVTGQEDPTKETSGIDWKALSGMGTVVFLMGVSRLPEIVGQLMEQGRAAETPVAIIRWGTWPQQETVTGTLKDIVGKATGMRPPAIIVVGEVVRVRHRLRWFESRPLFGRKIVVTRAREQQSSLAEQLEELGAEVLECPTIAIRPPESWDPLDRAISEVEQYAWILFSSVNGVQAFCDRLRKANRDLRALSRAKVAAIGPATAAALQSRGLHPDLVPVEFQAESLLEALEAQEIRGARILFPRASVARDLLPDGLRARGATVDVVPAYQTTPVFEHRDRILDLMKAGRIDAVTFTSSSTVTNFAEMFAGEDLTSLLAGTKVACIGPITAETAMRFGIRPHIQARVFTIPALVDALVAHFTGAGAQTPAE